MSEIVTTLVLAVVVLGVPLWAVVLTAIWAPTARRRAAARRVLLIAIRQPMQEPDEQTTVAVPKKRNVFGTVLVVTVFLLLMCLVVVLSTGELARNDQLASVVSVFIGTASLVVALVTAVRTTRG